MTRPLISCIIPVHNGERYLAEAIESILGQTWKELEVIVADDGSTDGSRRVAQSFGEAVQVVGGPQAGPSAARNRGIAASSGQFVAFLDADDLWPSHKLSRQMERFGERPELDISVGWVQNFWDETVRHEEEAARAHGLLKPTVGYVAGTMLARAQVFATVGLFDPARSHGESMEWFLRVREHGLVVEALHEVLLHRRIHAANRSRHLQEESRDEFLRLIKRTLDRRRMNEREAE
ncbi:MAG: glycosyltransferase family 2 protein [Acidobacteria bacterium]|nr:glycosyltransferase family 2 protein [Acidobacteriota bacterium]